MKYIMIAKLLQTTENLSSNKNNNSCNTTTTNNSFNNDSEIPRPNNTHLGPPQWDMLSTTSDTTTTSDNERSINIIASISIEVQLREVRLQKMSSLRNIRECIQKRKSQRKNLILTHQILVS